MNAMMNVVAVEEVDQQQALVTTPPGSSCGLTTYQRVPLHPPPQPRPPLYGPPSPTSPTPKTSDENEPRVPSAGQQGIQRAAGPQQSGRSLPPGGSTTDSAQMNRLLQARRDAVLRRRSKQRERAQQLATAIEARVDQMAQSDWTSHSQRPRQSPAQLLEAKATMREPAVAPCSSPVAGHYSERPSLAMRAMRWGTYESTPPPPPPPPSAQQKLRPRPILADTPPKPEISIAGALFASATAAKLLEKHDQRTAREPSKPETPEPQPQPEPQEQLELLPTPTRPKPEVFLAVREDELEPKVDPDPNVQPEPEPAATDVQIEKLEPSPTSKPPGPHISIGVRELELEASFEPEPDPLQPEPLANDAQINKTDWLTVAIAKRANKIRARSDATLLIQAAFRGSRVRRRRAKMAAVGQIQRFWRGRSARRRVSLLWLWWEETVERHAATKIAALWRGYSVRQLRGRLGAHTFHTQRQTDFRPHVYTAQAIPRLYEASLMRTDVETDGHGLRREVPTRNEEDDASTEGSCLSELSDGAYWETIIDFDAASRIQALARGWLRRRWETRLKTAIQAGEASSSSVAASPPPLLPPSQDDGVDGKRRLRIGYKVHFAT